MPTMGAQAAEEDRWHGINYLREATAADGEGEHGGGVEHSHEDHGEHSHE